jgi:urease accessory protein
MVTPGRVASGEHFEYDICYMKAVSKNQNGRFRFYDVAILEPKKRNMGAFGVLEKLDVFGTIYVLTETKYVFELNEKINQNLKDIAGVIGGATILPESSGVLIRLLGARASDLRMAMFDIVRIVRKVVLNAPFSGIRKG